MRHISSLFVFALAAPIYAQTSCLPTIANETLTPSVPGVVNSIRFYHDLSGAGRQFFAAGSISTMGNVVRLTPTGWQQVGNGLAGAVNTLEIIDDATGPGNNLALYAGGAFGLARWNGSSWDAIAPNPGSVSAVVRFDDGTGPTTYVLAGGDLRKFNTATSTWQRIASASFFAPQGPTDRVLVCDDDGPGPRPSSIFLCSFNNFTPVGSFSSTSANGFVRFDGAAMQALPDAHLGTWIKSAAIFDDGTTGPAVYISAHPSGNNPAVLRWNPADNAWANVGPLAFSGDAAYALTVFADGVTPRPRLYAIGAAASVNVTPNSYIAAWDGQTWTRIWNRPIGSAQSMNYHLPSASGTLGAAHTPALLYAGLGSSTSTSFYAIVGCPRCPGDVDLDGQTTVADLFLFLNAWFAYQPSSDIGGNGQTAQDILDFLSGWFLPCG